MTTRKHTRDERQCAHACDIEHACVHDEQHADL
jgi:hypothetical protein